MNPDMDAIYFLSPQSHIVECLMSDLERRRYRRAFLVWISILSPKLRHRIDQSPVAQNMIASYETLTVDFFPRESHLITFRDPWSFPILYHPGCNDLVRDHMQTLAQRVRFRTVPRPYFLPLVPLPPSCLFASYLVQLVFHEAHDLE